MNESAKSYPGDEIVSNALIQLQNCIEIAASPADIWSWLVLYKNEFNEGGLTLDEAVAGIAKPRDFRIF